MCHIGQTPHVHCGVTAGCEARRGRLGADGRILTRCLLNKVEDLLGECLIGHRPGGASVVGHDNCGGMGSLLGSPVRVPEFSQHRKSMDVFCGGLALRRHSFDFAARSIG
jgi:hypothetical protein